MVSAGLTVVLTWNYMRSQRRQKRTAELTSQYRDPETRQLRQEIIKAGVDTFVSPTGAEGRRPVAELMNEIGREVINHRVNGAVLFSEFGRDYVRAAEILKESKTLSYLSNAVGIDKLRHAAHQSQEGNTAEFKRVVRDQNREADKEYQFIVALYERWKNKL